MSATSTTYDVRVKYMVDRSGATSGLNDIGRAAANTGNSLSGLTDKLKQVGMALTAYIGFRAGYEHLINYNAELQNTQASLRTIIQLNSSGMGFTEAGSKATALMSQFQMDVKEVPGTVQDLGEFAAGISQAVLQAGGTVNDLREITKNSFTASKAMFPGMGAEMAQLEVTETLMGNLTKRNRFGRGVMRAAGYEEAQVNAMDPLERLKAYMKALSAPAIKDAQKGYLTSWAGVTSTFENTIKTSLGKVGLPLFQAISKEILSWNDWINANGDKIADFGRSFTDGLMVGFRTIKTIMGFVVEHKDLLMTLAKAWLAGKAVSMMANGVMGAAGAFQNLASSAGGGLLGLTKAAGGAAAALGLIAGAAVAIADWVDKKHEEQIDAEVKKAGFRNLFDETNNGHRSKAFFYEESKRMGLLNETGTAFKPETNPLMQQTGKFKVLGFNLVQAPLEAIMNQMLQQGMEASRIAKSGWATRDQAFIKANLGLEAPGDMAKALKPQVNIGKIVMNVESNDPDNFAIGMEGYFRAWTSNPTSNPKSVREGR